MFLECQRDPEHHGVNLHQREHANATRKVFENDTTEPVVAKFISRNVLLSIKKPVRSSEVCDKLIYFDYSQERQSIRILTRI